MLRGSFFICLALLLSSCSAYDLNNVAHEALRDIDLKRLRDVAWSKPVSGLRVDPLAQDVSGASCCNCTKESSDWVMDHVIEYLEKKCEETECPKLKELCEKAREHPKVAYGFLFAAVRPVALGYAYCSGKGACGEEADSAYESENGALASSMEQLTSMVSNIDSEGVMVTSSGDINEVLAGTGPGAGKSCLHCIRGVAKGTIWHVVGQIKKICYTTEKPAIQKMV